MLCTLFDLPMQERLAKIRPIQEKALAVISYRIWLFSCELHFWIDTSNVEADVEGDWRHLHNVYLTLLTKLTQDIYAYFCPLIIKKRPLVFQRRDHFCYHCWSSKVQWKTFSSYQVTVSWSQYLDKLELLSRVEFVSESLWTSILFFLLLSPVSI